jgi:hypothetical protein
MYGLAQSRDYDAEDVVDNEHSKDLRARAASHSRFLWYSPYPLYKDVALGNGVSDLRSVVMLEVIFRHCFL